MNGKQQICLVVLADRIANWLPVDELIKLLLMRVLLLQLVH
jgi:hypothetical protein